MTESQWSVSILSTMSILTRIWLVERVEFGSNENKGLLCCRPFPFIWSLFKLAFCHVFHSFGPFCHVPVRLIKCIETAAAWKLDRMQTRIVIPRTFPTWHAHADLMYKVYTCPATQAGYADVLRLSTVKHSFLCDLAWLTDKKATCVRGPCCFLILTYQ